MEKALALRLILTLCVSLLVGAQFVSLVGANGYLYRMGFKVIEPLPGTIPPEIAILSPENYTVYSGGDLNVTIHVTRPITSHVDRFGPLRVNYFQDGTFQDMKLFDDPPSEMDINAVLSNISSGSHELLVQVNCDVEPGSMTIFTVHSNSTVYFTVKDTSSLSPSPSPEATFTSEPAMEPVSFPTSLVVASSVTVVAVLVGLGLLVYLIKRK